MNEMPNRLDALRGNAEMAGGPPAMGGTPPPLPPTASPASAPPMEEDRLASLLGGMDDASMMPEEEMITAQKVSINSDLFICLGSSLAVFPAADLPLLAKETGANLVIVNNEPTQMDHLSDLVINRDISEVLSEISLF